MEILGETAFSDEVVCNCSIYQLGKSEVLVSTVHDLIKWLLSKNKIVHDFETGKGIQIWKINLFLNISKYNQIIL